MRDLSYICRGKLGERVGAGAQNSDGGHGMYNGVLSFAPTRLNH